MSRPTGLGRGLSALLGEAAREVPTGEGGARDGDIRLVDVAALRPDPQQPRRRFEPGALAELAESIRARGLIQPIVARPVEGALQIVAGERRWRAAQQAQLHQVPVIVREMSDPETLEIALIENVQRADLTAIEEAEAYARLAAQFGHSQETIGRLVGKSRPHVANLLRLLDLPEPVRDMVGDGRLQMGHARALLTAPDPIALAEETVKRGLSVRDVERLAKSARVRKPGPVEHKGAEQDIWALERRLSDLLGIKVGIVHRGGQGAVTLEYKSLDQLDMIFQRLSGEAI